MEIRKKILELAKHQKPDASWVELAELLEQAKKENLFREWDFDSFSAYCSAELHFGKSVASDMIRGRAFIEEHAPELLSANLENSVMTEKIPGYNEIALLRRAQKQGIPEHQFERLKKALFNNKLTRDQLRAKINILLPAREKRSESIGDLKIQILELKKRIRDLEQEARCYRARSRVNGVDREQAEKMRRVIMRYVHPDKGGSTEVAQEVNNFFDQIIH